MQVRDRIKEFRRVRASQLQPHPQNWRTHPPVQRAALQGLLAEVGYADALLVRETAAGGLMLIDGHLRAETTPDQEVPVLVLDVSEAEAAKLLATLDPLAGQAQTDPDKLESLVREVQTSNAGLQQLLDDLARQAQQVVPVEPALPPPPPPESAPPLTDRPTKFAIVVNCESEQEQLDLLARFAEEGLTCRALVM
ncbi:MAG: hypothetical protein JSS02_18330 [Planctomycetes bacterium]|nr:hypothetical protein [Planctomycetota bacterium]